MQKKQINSPVSSGTSTSVHYMGQKISREQLNNLFKAEPHLLDQAADLSYQAENAWIGIAASEPIVIEAMRIKCQELKHELSGPSPTPLENLIIQRIIACSLQVNYFETMLGQNMNKVSPILIDQWQKQLDKAHRRYMSAIRTLALVRRYQIPMMQVNIGQNQLNVAQPATNLLDPALKPPF